MKPEKTTFRFLHSAQAPKRLRRLNHSILFVLAASISVLFVSAGLDAQSAKPSAYQVEAAYIFNFGKFVKWPANAAANQSSQFTICVLGDDPFDSVLQSTLAGQSLGGRPVTVRRIPKPQNASGCHILFINAAEEGHLQAILSAIDEAAVLTVSDMPGFSKRGGMIQFVLEDGRVRFAINRGSAEGNGLVLASDLLKVATSVIGTGRTGGE